MGTPEFAVASLDILLQYNFNIAAIVTAPDKPAGRGLQVQETAVKKYAAEHHLKILQPRKLKDPLFIEELRSLQADLQVVVAFRMLPEIVWNMPPLGTINLHGSLLPQYRGAAPINWAIINGEKETGVTTFKLQHAIDTGNILFSATLPIGEEETAGELHDKMMREGARVLLKTVQKIAAGNHKEIPQPDMATPGDASGTDHPVLKTAPKIFKEDCKIDWNKPAEKVYNLIRGLSPYPTAWTILNGKTLKVYKASKEINAPGQLPGMIDTDQKTYLKYSCADGWIRLLELQIEGKKRMGIEEFLRGYRSPA